MQLAMFKFIKKVHISNPTSVHHQAYLIQKSPTSLQKMHELEASAEKKQDRST